MVRLGDDLQPAILHLIVVRTSPGHVKSMISIPQLKSSLAQPLGISKTTFYRAVDTLKPAKRFLAPAPLLSKLREIGVIPAKTPRCEAISLHSASIVLKALQVKSSIVESMLQKVEATLVPQTSPSSSEKDPPLQANIESPPKGQATVPPPPAEDPLEDPPIIDQSQATPSDSAYYHPSSIDVDADLDYPSTEATARYGLNTIRNKAERQACMSFIQLDMASFQQWSQQVYQPGRDPKKFKQQGKATFESTKQRIHEFLGYLYNCQNVARPTLQMYSDSSLFQSFMGFLATRGIDKAGTLKVC